MQIIYAFIERGKEAKKLPKMRVKIIAKAVEQKKEREIIKEAKEEEEFEGNLLIPINNEIR